MAKLSFQLCIRWPPAMPFWSQTRWPCCRMVAGPGWGRGSRMIGRAAVPLGFEEETVRQGILHSLGRRGFPPQGDSNLSEWIPRVNDLTAHVTVVCGDASSPISFSVGGMNTVTTQKVRARPPRGTSPPVGETPRLTLSKGLLPFHTRVLKFLVSHV